MPGPNQKRVYMFAEGRIDQKELLGNKGANLCEMSRLGLPVPPGFVITTTTCLDFFEAKKKMPPGLKEEYLTALAQVEKQAGKIFGDKSNPLLLSVRSGAAVSMPGMMDTVLSLGLNDEIVAALVESTGNKKWAFDCYRRLIQMYQNVVLGKSTDPYEEVIKKMKAAKGYKYDMQMSGEDWEEVVRQFKGLGEALPTDPHEQLETAIAAVFNSWFTPRAVRYREYNNIQGLLGTACNVQTMVFGNKSADSGTGVAFTRNPATGENVFFGEYLEQAQGEDVVSGVRTPHSLAFLQQHMPEAYQELDKYQRLLETHFRDMQDLEFSVEDRKLYMLQTRTGKRTAKASVQIAVDMVAEGMITEQEALLRIDPERMNYFLHPTVDTKAPKTVLGKGLPASPGAATGAVVFSPEVAETMVKGDPNVKLILVRTETTADDIHGMRAATGIVTENGGMTSHAAVVARGMGKCCVAGAHTLHVDVEGKQFITKDGTVIKEGDVITLDGASGLVLLGDVPRMPPGADACFQTLMGWAHKHSRLAVAANADSPEDARVALSYGATGIGLCRTEHMFFPPERIDIMREMILAETEKERQKALDRLFAFQKADMRAMFEVMTGKHVTIRLLDPPLHEFLPTNHHDAEALAARIGKPVETVLREISELKEANPMLGFRGCRLTIKFPEITLMQVRAIIMAAVEAQAGGAMVHPEIMIPLVATSTELEVIVPLVEAEIRKIFAESGGITVPYRLGTMVEVPRACLTAEKIAPFVSFISFGTNDLTQMTWGFSRDDVSHFLPQYLEKKVIHADPFVSIDEEGVGQLIKMTTDKMKTQKNGGSFTAGICGEHGGDPASVAFFSRAGLDYVSCSPYRVPIAWIAAAQSAVKEGFTKEKGQENGK